MPEVILNLGHWVKVLGLSEWEGRGRSLAVLRERGYGFLSMLTRGGVKSCVVCLCT